MAQPGQQAAAKKETYSDEEIEALAAYVASLGPGPAIPDESDYSIEGLTEDEQRAAISRGGQLFLTNCTACHNFDGSGRRPPPRPLRPEPEGRRPRSTSTRPCSPARSRCPSSATA